MSKILTVISSPKRRVFLHQMLNEMTTASVGFTFWRGDFLEENYKGQRKKIFICVLMFSKLAYSQNNFCLICLCGIIYLFIIRVVWIGKLGWVLRVQGKKGQSRLFCSTTTSEMVLEWFERLQTFMQLSSNDQSFILMRSWKTKKFWMWTSTCIWDSYQNRESEI